MLRILPELRSAYIERFEDAPQVETLYFKQHYLDESLLESTAQLYVQTSFWGALRRCIGGATVLEVPEPLWTRRTLQTLLLAVAYKACARLARRPSRIATYCIENEAAERIARLPEWVPAALRRAALRPLLWVYAFVIDRWAFGTEDSRRTYERVAGRRLLEWRLGSRSKLFLPLPSRCRECELSGAREGLVFLGSLERRKGFDDFCDAVERDAVGSESLWILGDGPLRERAGRLAELQVATWISAPTRAQIHSVLAGASAVILPSVPERYWREQIGLPILEGLAHGCNILTTPDTGLADWLTQQGHRVAVGSACLLEDRKEAYLNWDAVIESLPDVNGRAQAAEWMFSMGEI